MNSTIIELANLKLETKQAGKVIFPSNIYDEKYIGPLYGYYVPDTNVFNVIPIDSPNRIKEDKRISLLGYVLPINPLKFILNENQISDSEDTDENSVIWKDLFPQYKFNSWKRNLELDTETSVAL